MFSNSLTPQSLTPHNAITVIVVVAVYTPFGWTLLEPEAARKFTVVTVPVGLLAEARLTNVSGEVDSPSQHAPAV